MPRRGTTTARRAQIAERRADAIALRIRGKPWSAIATALGYRSAGAACQDVSRALGERLRDLAQQADILRELELAKLDALDAAAWSVLEHDDGPTLPAIDRVLRISERRAKLLGLDSPVRLDVEVARYEIVGVDLTRLT